MKKLLILGNIGIIVLVNCSLTYAFDLVERAEYRAQIVEERTDISFDRQSK